MKYYKNLMHTPRALFSRLFLQICLFVLSLSLSLYLRSASYLSCEISVTSPIISVNSHYRVRGQSTVCVYTQSKSDNAFKRYGRLIFFQNGLQPPSWFWFKPFDPPSPKTPLWNETRSWSDNALQSMAIWNFPKSVNWPWGWSLVGRQYSYFLHWCHILIFRYDRNVAREE